MVYISLNFFFHHIWVSHYTSFDYRKVFIENVSEILSSCSRKSKLLHCSFHRWHFMAKEM